MLLASPALQVVPTCVDGQVSAVTTVPPTGLAAPRRDARHVANRLDDRPSDHSAGETPMGVVTAVAAELRGRMEAVSSAPTSPSLAAHPAPDPSHVRPPPRYTEYPAAAAPFESSCSVPSRPRVEGPIVWPR